MQLLEGQTLRDRLVAVAEDHQVLRWRSCWTSGFR
jgi:hypothetical protein